MYTIKIISEFSAAHNLRGYHGKCENLHGHNWKVEAEISKESLDKIGMAMDFKKFKNCLNAVLDKLDHKYLNETAYFKKINPTSENIAKYIYDELSRKIKNVSKVTVWESDTSRASFAKNG